MMKKALILFGLIALFGDFVSPNAIPSDEPVISPLTKKFYIMTLEKLTWAKAFKQCRSLDMKLASIESEEEHNQIIEQLLNEGVAENSMYTSGARLGNNDTFKWMGNNKPVTYTNWASGEPSNYNNQENCINIYGTFPWKNSEPFTWNDISCNEELYFICEKEQTNDNNVEISGHAITAQKKFYPITSKKLTWSQAWKHCRYLNMRLASIESQEEQDQLADKITNEAIDEYSWTSGVIVDNNGTLQWFGSNKQATYFNWNGGEPNRAGGRERCVNIYGLQQGPTPFSWNDKDCSDEMYFICERQEDQNI